MSVPASSPTMAATEAFVPSSSGGSSGSNGSLASPDGAGAAMGALGQILSGASVAMVVASVLALVVTTLVWRRYASPLRGIPGPFWASLTRLWHVKIIIDGNQNEQLRDAHDKYGPFVRMAPNEVSVSHPEGVKKLLLATLPKVRQQRHRAPGRPTLLRVLLSLTSPPRGYRV